jgi:hypothetical protein
MILPSISKCEENKKQLIKKWTKGKVLNHKELEKRKTFFQNCYVFHHFKIPQETINHYLTTNTIQDLLPDGLLKSSHEIHASQLFHPVGITLDWLDPLFGLDQFVFFSFGAPQLKTGNYALVFALPLQKLLDKFEYPQIWVSWGDIFTYAMDIVGVHQTHKLNKTETSKIIRLYQNVIIQPKDIAELAAIYTITHNKSVSEIINQKWLKEYGYFGPEIKISNNFPVKHFTHCFVNDLDSTAGKIAKVLYEKRILPVEPTTDRFFNKDIFKRFYVDYMEFSI